MFVGVNYISEVVVWFGGFLSSLVSHSGASGPSRHRLGNDELQRQRGFISNANATHGRRWGFGQRFGDRTC